MKNIFIYGAWLLVCFSSCSKCYECVETQDILDSNGNVIDQTEVHQNVCTADQNEIVKRENNGAVCLRN
ncbi:MAG: hypothetical protein ACI85Q_001487 [Salibacteraceae bacterium]|jgi:hypothetical protein